MRPLRITEADKKSLDLQLRGRLFIVHSITDGKGVSKDDSNDFFRKYYHGIILNARINMVPDGTGEFNLKMDCVQDRDGNRLNDVLTTSRISHIIISANYIQIATSNSVYVLRSLKSVPMA